MNLYRTSVFHRLFALMTCLLFCLSGCTFQTSVQKPQNDSSLADSVSPFQSQGDSSQTDSQSSQPAAPAKSEPAASSEAKAASPYVYVKEMPDIDPDSIPFAYGSVYFANLADGTIQAYSPQGDPLLETPLTSMVYVPYSSASQFLGKETNSQTQQIFDILQEEGTVRIVPHQGAGDGLGCAGFYCYYNPSTKQVYIENPAKGDIPAMALAFQPFVGYPNAVRLMPGEKEDPSEPFSQPETLYAWDLGADVVYGPFSREELYCLEPELKGYSCYTNCNNTFSTFLCLLDKTGTTLIGGTETAGPFAFAQVTGMEYAYVQDQGTIKVIGPSLKEETILPAQASLCSGKVEDSILVLEDGVWKLYEDPTGASRPVSTDYPSNEPVSAGSETMILTSGMHVRQQPSLEAEETGVLPAGTEVRIGTIVTDENGSVWGEVLSSTYPYASFLNGYPIENWICIEDKDTQYLVPTDSQAS